MLKLIALINCIFLSSVAFTSNLLDSDLSGEWIMEFSDQNNPPITISVSKSDLLRTSEKLGNAVLYSIIASDNMSEYFGMSIMKNYDNNNHVVWYRPSINRDDKSGHRRDIDTESNIIRSVNDNEFSLGTDLDSEKDFAVLRKL